MRIDSAQNVGIGTVSPASLLHVDSDNNFGNILLSRDGGAGGRRPFGIGITGAADNDLTISASADTDQAGAFEGDRKEIVRFLAGGGMTFNGDTAAANALNDYEEGVHQTAITMSSSGTVTLNTSYDSLSYTKVGRLVTITGHPRIASVSSPVGSMYLSLPFTAKNGQQDESRSGGVLNYYDNSGGSGSYYKLLAMQINQNSNLLGINNTHTANFNLTPAASDEIYLNFCYITD